MEPIPGPAGYPIIGNILEIDPEHPTDSLGRIADAYGPIFTIRAPKERTIVANYELAKELLDEKRFQKAVQGPLKQVRHAAGDGLFTAYPGEHNWELAHRLLIPAFGPLSIQSMFPEMQDIVSQLVLKWARFGENQAIDVSDDFTRLTLDSIAICAMGDRFNSFYKQEQHPFVHAMVGTLRESFARERRLPLPSAFYATKDKEFEADIASMVETAQDLIDARRKHPTDKKDLLNAMLYSKDHKTGEQLSDDTIIRNMITFLIAGHETTSGMLSFLFYELLSSPQAYRRAQEEVDAVIGKDTITVAHMGKLPYLEACLRETLRLHPTAPLFAVAAKGDQVIGGKYLIKDGVAIGLLLPKLHRDPAVYGDDAEAFRPERMYGEAFTKLPPGAWRPFGNGMRACIGRPFAWQEALLATATVLQVFQFSKVDPHYTLQIKSTLTIKPDGFFMKARLRDASFLQQAYFLTHGQPTPAAAEPKSAVNPSSQKSKISILYGSNTGTCEALAQALAASAPRYGFEAEVRGMDEAVSGLQKDRPVVVFTASYEGEPPDNAAHFVEWLKSDCMEEVKGVQYAVFGVGNKEWYNTYQKIPTVVDEALAKNGAERLTERVGLDVTSDNVFDTLDNWQEHKFWPSIKGEKAEEAASGPAELPISINTQLRSTALRQDMRVAQVSDARLLTKSGAARKRHISIHLPTGLSYRSGDYLAVLPLNPPQTVRRAMRRFKLPWDAMVTIDDGAITTLPKNTPIAAGDLLAGTVELSQPVTSRALTAVATSIPETDKREALLAMAKRDDFQHLNITLLDILEDYPSANFPLGAFLAAIPPMRVRQYSMSSSPLQDPTSCTLTYSVLDAPQRSGRKNAQHLGACSTYLERLTEGDHLQISLRPSRTGFHLPSDDTTNIVMACAGTGLAPFRAFVQERALKKSNGIEIGKAILYYGCRHPDEDDMYRDEFDVWERDCVVSVRRAFSGAPDKSAGCRHVDDRILLDKEELAQLFAQGSSLYLCGSGAVGASVEKAMVTIRAEIKGESHEEATGWVRELRNTRFWADIFS